MWPLSNISSHSTLSTPHTSSRNDSYKDSRQSAVRSDIHKALRLLNRSTYAKSFLLTPFEPSSQLSLLTSPHPSFTIATKEEQEGTLPGQIGLCYLGLPAFSETEGLSGGLVVTRYATRTHPLHDPSFISDIRFGRYVRDDASGEWCMITRSSKDRVVRLQYMNVNCQGDRERISITCDAQLFDCGRYTDSVYFKCHDHEWHICPSHSRSGCRCQNLVNFAQSTHRGLAAAAHSFIREGAREWLGTVRVTVLNRFSIVPLLDVDDTMIVRSTYKAGVDGTLISQIRHLAVLETMSLSQSSLTIHRSISLPQDSSVVPKNPGPSSANRKDDVKSPGHFPPLHSHVPSLPLTPPLTPTKKTELIGDEFSYFAPSSTTMPWDPELICEDFFGSTGSDEVADHFLVLKDLPFSCFDDNEPEYPMVPADLSTLPAGVESCLDGMDLEDLDDDCFSLMTSERDTQSLSSALSTAGSDGIPSLDSVPMPGDDVLDAISALNLSSPTEEEIKNLSEGLVSGTKDAVRNLSAGDLAPLANSTCGDTRTSTTSGATSSGSLYSDQIKSFTPLKLSFGLELSPIHNSKTESLGHVVDGLSHTTAGKFNSIKPDQDNTILATGPKSTPIVHTDSDYSGVAASAEEKSESDAKLVPKPTCTEQVPTYGIPHSSDPCTETRSDVSLGNVQEKVAAYPKLTFPVVTSVHGGISLEHGHGQSILPFVPYQTPYGRPVAAVAVNGHEHQGVNVLHGQSSVANDFSWSAIQTQGTPPSGPCLSPPSIGKGSEALKLAPRPPGMNVSDSPTWNLSPMFGSNHWVMASRLEALERERKAEERRKKNRQAAARSNAKKKNLMDGIRSEICKCKKRAEDLKSVQDKLLNENGSLKRRVLDLGIRK